MAQINISGLTFYYEGSYDAVFENASFSMDTDWKLGGKYEYSSIRKKQCWNRCSSRV